MKLLPGLLLTAGIAATAIWLHMLPFLGPLSPLILAIAIGIGIRNTVGISPIVQPGITFSLKRILRLAIVFLGFQLSFAQVGQVGLKGLGIVTGTLIATFVFTEIMGRRLGIDAKLTQLIAAGTAICGASAVIATNVVTEGRDEDVAYAVALVTIFGSIAMFLYPVFPRVLHLSPHEFGLWTGASIHEIAQVVAAAFQDGKVAGDFGTISKLSRVMLLAPVVISLSFLQLLRKSGNAGFSLNIRSLPIPWFVFGFIIIIAINSLDILPHTLRTSIIGFNQFLLALSLGAMGLETSMRALSKEGLKPLLLGGLAWLFIASFSFLLIHYLY